MRGALDCPPPHTSLTPPHPRWLASIPQAGNFTVVRLFRALRPLRTVKRIPQLKTLVVALLAAVPQLRNVMSIFCLFFFIIGIFALQMYAAVTPNSSTSVTD